MNDEQKRAAVLAACPFCKKPAEIHLEGFLKGRFYIGCSILWSPYCKVHPNINGWIEDGIDEAISEWNNQSLQPAPLPEDVAEAIEAAKKWLRLGHVMRDWHVETLIRAAQPAETVTLDWITSDEPPEEGLYIVTTASEETGYNRKVEISRYGKKGWYLEYDGRTVVAWRRMIETYNGLRIVKDK